MSRKDGRKANEIRKIELIQSSLSKSDGSAQFSFGATSVLCSCRGPVEIRIAKEEIDRATLEIFIKPLHSSPGPTEKSFQQFLSILFSSIIDLKLYPKSLIQLSLQIISAPTLKFSTEITSLTHSSPSSNTLELDSVSLKAASINSIYLSLLDAGIALDSIVTSVAVAIVDSEVILDPTILEESKASSNHLLIYKFVGEAESELIGLHSSGRFNLGELEGVRELGMSGCEGVKRVLRKAVEGKYGVKEEVKMEE